MTKAWEQSDIRDETAEVQVIGEVWFEGDEIVLEHCGLKTMILLARLQRSCANARSVRFAARRSSLAGSIPAHSRSSPGRTPTRRKRRKGGFVTPDVLPPPLRRRASHSLTLGSGRNERGERATTSGIIGLMPDWMDIPDWADEMFEPIRRRSLEANAPLLEKLDVSRADLTRMASLCRERPDLVTPELRRAVGRAAVRGATRL
jgi:hypothetical protein